MELVGQSFCRFARHLRNVLKLEVFRISQHQDIKDVTDPKCEVHDSPSDNRTKKHSFLKGAIPLCIINIYYISTVNTQHMRSPDVYYNWVIPGDMFRQLNGHLQANLE
jgi:hypothetical protein